jgi:hypothetical protein
MKLTIQKKLKKWIQIQSHISRILSTSTLYGFFIRYQGYEFPPSLESWLNSLWPWCSELPQISHQISSNSDVNKLLHSVQTRIFSSHWQLSMIITPGSLVGLRDMGSQQKPKKLSYDVGIEGFLIWHSNWGQKFRLLGRSILSRTEFQQPGQLPEVITPKPLISSGHENNR